MSEDVKTRILDAAKRLFSLKGYDATSVRQICEEAGANVALVSYHFGGKEKLLFAMFEEYYPETGEYEEFDQVVSPIERLHLFIQKHTKWKLRHPEVGQIFYNEMMLQSERSELIQKYSFEVWGRLRKTLVDGQEQGIFHFESVDRAFLQVMGSLIFPHHYAFFAPLLDVDSFQEEEIIRTSTHYIFQGLGVHTTEK